MKTKTITINCELKEQADAFIQILMLNKRNLQHHLNSILKEKNIRTDTNISVQDDVINITSSTQDRGLVVVSNGLSANFVEYKDLMAPSKYIYVEDGVVSIAAKLSGGVDEPLGSYGTLQDAISNFNSNDIEDAYHNVLRISDEINNKEDGKNND